MAGTVNERTKASSLESRFRPPGIEIHVPSVSCATTPGGPFSHTERCLRMSGCCTYVTLETEFHPKNAGLSCMDQR